MLFNTLRLTLNSFSDYNLSQKGDLLLSLVSDQIEEAIEKATFREDHYSREIIHQVRDFDVVLIGWMPGQSSPIHNHPTNGCLVYPIKGQLFEERFCEELHPISETTVGVGNYSYIDNGICVHRLGNASSTEHAISVHIYSPSNFVPTIFNKVGHKEEGVKVI